jgi:hypothetical protein
MVHIKFSARFRVPLGSPSPSPMALDDVGVISAEHKESLMERLDATLVDEEPMASTEVTSEQDVGSDESDTSGDTGDSGNALDNGGRVKIGVEVALVGISFDFGWSKVMRSRISDLKSSFRVSLKDLLSHLTYSLLCSNIFSLLAFAYLRTLCFWIFFTNFRCSYFNLLRTLLFKSTNLFGLSRLVEVTLVLKFSLVTTSYIIKTRRFILRGPRLPSLHSLGAYPFIHLDLGITLGLLKPRGINEPVVGIVTGSSVRCLQNRAMISQAKKLIR